MRAQVNTGRYRTASEVVRDGLRLLEETEHRRLVEKWIYEDLSESERTRLPNELKARVQAYFRNLVDEGLRSAEEGGWVDGPEAVEQLRTNLLTRPSSTS